MKHNKKRNTAFIFEVLIRELTKAILEQDEKKKKYIITNAMKKYLVEG